jgi:hypothetical protein
MAAMTKHAVPATKHRNRRNKGSKEIVSEDKIGRDGKNAAALAEEHLPPLFLVGVVLMCSGVLFVLAMRDFCSTGKVIAGSWDEAFMVILYCYLNIEYVC